MDLTTVARVKVALEMTASTYDALLAQVVTGLSAMAEKYLGVWALEAARTVYFDVEPGDSVFYLKGWPVHASASFAVKNDSFRNFTVAALDAGDYRLDRARGRLAIDGVTLFAGYGALQVTYTGGLGATAAAVVTAFPDIATAVDLQACYMYRRQPYFGLASISSPGGAISFPGVQSWEPTARELLRQHRRIGGKAESE